MGEKDQDQACAAFLDLLERDIADHPERLRPMTHELAERMRRLTAGIEIDLDEEIEGPVAI
jgi:antitoxin PrlF